MKLSCAPKTYAYLRVSSDKQDAKSQRHEVQRYAEKTGLTVDHWIEVELSATKNGFKKRRIEELLRTVRPGDTLIVPMISRLARSVKEVHEICSELLRKKVLVHFIKQALLLKADLPSKIIVNAFGLAAEIEADLISQRTKAGLAAAKAKGVKLGNPNLKRDNVIRSRNADEFALALEKTIRGYQALGMTQRAIVRELNETKIKTRRGGHWYQATLQNLLKRLGKGWREERMKR